LPFFLLLLLLSCKVSKPLDLQDWTVKRAPGFVEYGPAGADNKAAWLSDVPLRVLLVSICVLLCLAGENDFGT
jgi:hypothetical protein